MPFPLAVPLVLMGAAAVAGAFGLKKGLDAHSNMSEAERYNADARRMYDKAENQLETAKSECTEMLADLCELKLDVWNRQLGRFIELFDRLKNVELEGEHKVGTLRVPALNMDELKQHSIKAGEILAYGVGALGAGAMAGVAAFGGVGWLGAASTGASIASLSGVAATNATLAWFGGGAIAAGGLGMSVGAAVLGGIVAGPVLAAGGMLLEAKSRESLANARSHYAAASKAAEEMGAAADILDATREVAEQYATRIRELDDRMTVILEALQNVMTDNGLDYSRYGKSQKQVVHVSMLSAQLMKLLLETPLMSEDGSLDDNALDVLKQGVKTLNSGKLSIE